MNKLALFNRIAQIQSKESTKAIFGANINNKLIEMEALKIKIKAPGMFFRNFLCFQAKVSMASGIKHVPKISVSLVNLK